MKKYYSIVVFVIFCASKLLCAMEASTDGPIPAYIIDGVKDLEHKITLFIEQEKIATPTEKRALLMVVYHYLSMVMGSAYDAVRWHEDFRECGQQCNALKQAIPIMHARQYLFKALSVEKMALAVAKMAYTSPCYDYSMEMFEQVKVITFPKDTSVRQAYRVAEQRAFSYLREVFYVSDGTCWLKAAYDAALSALYSEYTRNELLELALGYHLDKTLEGEARSLLEPLSNVSNHLNFDLF